MSAAGSSRCWTNTPCRRRSPGGLKNRSPAGGWERPATSPRVSYDEWPRDPSRRPKAPLSLRSMRPTPNNPSTTDTDPLRPLSVWLAGRIDWTGYAALAERLAGEVARGDRNPTLVIMNSSPASRLAAPAPGPMCGSTTTNCGHVSWRFGSQAVGAERPCTVPARSAWHSSHLLPTSASGASTRADISPGWKGPWPAGSRACGVVRIGFRVRMASLAGQGF